MSNISYNIRRISLLFLCFAAAYIMNACSPGESAPPAPNNDNSLQTTEETLPLRDHTPVIPEIRMPGTVLYENGAVSLDASNASNGYISLIYHGSNEKVKFRIAAPNNVVYTYLISQYEEPIVFPLTGGSGSYTFSLLEAVDVLQDKYALVFSETAEVTISDEFLPYLTPNVYASFTRDSSSVNKGAELAGDCYTDLDVINRIYDYVTGTITYDEEKAQNVVYGYIPDPDETLESGKGICFDYASLMTAMLRSQRIPTRLEVGYVKDIYHAWISCYVAEIGWVDNIIQFDGETWSLMDPTLAAGNNSTAVQEYIGDGSSYLVKYTY